MTDADTPNTPDESHEDDSAQQPRIGTVVEPQIDDDLEKLLGLKGAKRSGKHFIRVQKELEALDTDGDAKITFKEFAKRLEYVKPPQEPLAPVAQLRRLVGVLAGPVNPVRCDARVRVGLAEGEEVDPGLEGADMVRRAVGEGPVRVARPQFGREVIVPLHVRVEDERAGFWGHGDVHAAWL